MTPERAGALATALSLSRVQRARLRAAFLCFCRAVDVEGVGRVWMPARDDDPLRALFRVISSSKAFYAAQKHSAALW